MTRTQYGPVVIAIPGAGGTLTSEKDAVIAARTPGGTQETDLTTATGSGGALSPGSAIAAPDPDDTTGVAVWFGPDGYTGSLWVKDPVTNIWWEVPPAGLANRVGAVASVSVNGGTPQIGAVALSAVTGLSVDGGPVQHGDVSITSGGGGSAVWGSITGQPAVIAAGVDAATARSAIGAGTSSLTLGTTSSTAKPGDYAPDLSAYATKASNLQQFADVPDGTPADGTALVWDDATGARINLDLDARFAQIDSATQQLVPSAYPQGFIPTAIVNEGENPPSWALVQVIIPAGASLDPVLDFHVVATNTNQVIGATTQAYAVGDPLVFVVLSSAEAVSPVEHTFTFATGAATLTKREEAASGTTAQMDIYSGRCTTAIPAGTNVTTKSVTVGTTTQVNRVHLQSALVKTPNLVSSPTQAFDQGQTGTISSTTTLTIQTALTPTLAQSRELGIFGVGINAGASGATPLITRTVAGSAGWTLLSFQRSENSPTGSARGMAVFFQSLNVSPATAQRGSGTIVVTGDTQSGQAAAVVAFFKGA